MRHGNLGEKAGEWSVAWRGDSRAGQHPGLSVKECFVLGPKGTGRAAGAGRWGQLLQQLINQQTHPPSQRHTVFGNEGRGGVGRWRRRSQVQAMIQTVRVAL